MKKILFFCFLFLLISIFGLFHFRRSLVEKSAQIYLEKIGQKVDFKLKELERDRIIFTDIRASGFSSSEIIIHLDLDEENLKKIKRIDAQIEFIDLTQLETKGEAKTSSSPKQFSSQNIITLLDEINNKLGIKIKIGELKVDDENIFKEIELVVNSSEKKKNVLLKTKKEGEIRFDINNDLKKIIFKNVLLNLHLAKGRQNILVSTKEMGRIELVGVKYKVDLPLKKIEFKSDLLELDMMETFLKGEGDLEDDDFLLHLTNKELSFVKDDLHLLLSNTKAFISSKENKGNIRGIVSLDFADKKIIKNHKMRISFKKKKEKVLFSSKVESPLFQLTGKGVYDLNSNSYRLVGKYETHLDKIKDHTITDYYPEGEFEFKKIEGRMAGHYKILNKGKTNHISASGAGEHFLIETEDFRLSEGQFRFKIKDQQFVGEQFIHFESLFFGDLIGETTAFFLLPDLETVIIKSFKSNFWDGDIYGKDIILKPTLKKVERMKLQINHIDLQKVLAAGLKDDIESSGSLSGSIDIRSQNKKNFIQSGELTTDGKGFLRYRPKGQTAPPINISQEDFAPATLLKYYLYDFKYDYIKAKFSSDINYQLKMPVSTLGRNPKFLNGKPLKLGVNLDLNIWDLIRGVLLSYQLPESIKNKILEDGR